MNRFLKSSGVALVVVLLATACGVDQKLPTAEDRVRLAATDLIQATTNAHAASPPDAKALVSRAPAAAPLLVAASNAPHEVKDVAAYVCSGANDQVEIQRAIDSFGNDGGEVFLYGNFTIGKSSQSTELNGGGNRDNRTVAATYQTTPTDGNITNINNVCGVQIDLGTQYYHVNSGDVLYIQDGDYVTSHTVTQDANVDGYWPVTGVAAPQISWSAVPAGGTFSLTLYLPDNVTTVTTAPIKWNDSVAAVQAAINHALPYVRGCLDAIVTGVTPGTGPNGATTSGDISGGFIVVWTVSNCCGRRYPMIVNSNLHDSGGAAITASLTYTNPTIYTTPCTPSEVTLSMALYRGPAGTRAASNAYWCRPAWSIRIPDRVSLKGFGKYASILELDANANCCGVFCGSISATRGGQELHNLSLRGSSARQDTPYWWHSCGIVTGWTIDMFVRNCEVRYWKGFGVVCTQGWGWQASGGWIEDCYGCVYCISGPHFTDVKIQQASGPNTIVTNGRACFCNCEIRSRAARQTVIRQRGGHEPFSMTGGVLEADSGRCTAIACLYSGNAIYPSAPNIAGTSFYLDSTSTFLSVNAFLFGGQISGSWTSKSACAAVVGGNGIGCWLGANIEIGAPGLGTSFPFRAKSIGVTNQSGATMAYGKAYAWKPGGNAGMNDVTLAAPNDAAFAGVAGAFGVRSGSLRADSPAARTQLFVSGTCKLSVDARVPIRVGDLLAIGGNGNFVRAAPGYLAYAVAKEDARGGIDIIDGELIPPRLYR